MEKEHEFKSYHVGVAAEAIAAAQFARLGYDVSVQYGANQPEYDLLISKDDIILKVSVKGSQDGSWGLTQGFLTKGKADYLAATDKWLAKHGMKTIFCLVQFKNVSLDQLPKLYLAKPTEIAKRLKETSNGHGGTILHENHTWKIKKAIGYGSTDKIPDDWKFTKSRIELLFETIGK